MTTLGADKRFREADAHVHAAARVSEALDAIVEAREKLKTLGVVRTQRIVADYGEWIAEQVLGVARSTSPVQKGWDLEAPGRRIQVIAHAKADDNGAHRTTFRKPELEFDELAIVVFDPTYKLVSFFLLQREIVTNRFPFTLRTRTVPWSQLEEFSVRRVPAALAPLLSAESRLSTMPAL